MGAACIIAICDSPLTMQCETEAGPHLHGCNLMVEYYSGKTKEKLSGIMVYNLDKGKIEYDIEKERNRRQILFDGIIYEIRDGEVWWTEDCSDEIDEVIDAYKE